MRLLAAGTIKFKFAILMMIQYTYSTIMEEESHSSSLVLYRIAICSAG